MRPLAVVLALAAPLVACKPIDAAPGASAPLDAGDPCVADCIAKSQMQAKAPEQIEADCQRSCAGKDQSEQRVP